MRNVSMMILALVVLTNCMPTKKNINYQQEIKPISEVSQLKQPNITPLIIPISTPDQLVGYKWELIKISGLNIDTIDYHSGKPFIIFNLENNTISGYSGCNKIGGNCEIRPDSLKMGMIMSTKRFCMNIPEPEFLTNLEQTNRYEISNDSLNLYRDDQLLLKFTKKTN